MKQYNLFVVEGRLTREPEFKYTKNNHRMLKFAIANNYTTYDKNEGTKTEGVNYFNVMAFGDVAEIYSKYLKKGSHVMITGKLKQNRYKQNGETKTGVCVFADSIDFVSSGKRSKTVNNA